MSVFDLIFILTFLASVGTLACIAIALIRKRFHRAITILRIYGMFVVLYFLCDLVVAFAKPQRLIALGTPWCFDEWCLTATGVAHAKSNGADTYQVNLRISSEARGRPQRANGAWLYLIDERGIRYSPEPDASGVPLNALIQPQQSIGTSRTFKLPADVRPIGLITGHGGPYCGVMSILVIGDGGCVFNKPTMIHVQ